MTKVIRLVWNYIVLGLITWSVGSVAENVTTAVIFQDALYNVIGNGCNADSRSCPKKGDFAIDLCTNTSLSYRNDTQLCVALEDAECRETKQNNWFCMYPRFENETIYESFKPRHRQESPPEYDDPQTPVADDIPVDHGVSTATNLGIIFGSMLVFSFFFCICLFRKVKPMYEDDALASANVQLVASGELS